MRERVFVMNRRICDHLWVEKQVRQERFKLRGEILSILHTFISGLRYNGDIEGLQQQRINLELLV